MRINDRLIKGTEPPAKGYTLLRDGELTGFAFRVTAAGARAFVFGYTIDGRERRTTIGKWPAWTATAAREKARELRRLVDNGVDPLAEKQQRRVEPTFGELLAEYERVRVSQMRRGADAMTRLRRDVLPFWKNRKLSDIRRRDVIELAERRAAEAPISANRTLQYVRAVFSFGVKRDWLEVNPASNVEPPGGKELPRERVLTFDEIATVWHGVESGNLTATMRDILRFALLTAARSGELCTMRWSDVDLDSATWTIPTERSKNKRPHRLPLTSLALNILSRRQERRDCEWIFPSRYRRSGKPTSVAAVSTTIQLNNCFGLPHWTTHDLRRTVASHLASVGVEPHTISRLLNHSDNSITAVHYNTYQYDLEKRQALEKWERKLRSIIGQPQPAEVVAIR